jgi:hypothetical protein
MRHLALVAPGDPNAMATEDAFLFGPKLLAAPVLEPGAVERSVYLPRGRWIDLWRSATYREGSGALRLGEPETVAGRRTVIVPAPLEELPLFARAGTVLPLLPADVDTLAPYGDGPDEPVSLHDARRRMSLLAFPRGRSTATFYAGERLISREAGRGWTLQVRSERRRRYRLQASLATLRRPFEPCALSAGGEPLAPRRWSFDADTGLLIARFAMRRGALRAVPGRC